MIWSDIKEKIVISKITGIPDMHYQMIYHFLLSKFPEPILINESFLINDNFMYFFDKNSKFLFYDYDNIYFILHYKFGIPSFDIGNLIHDFVSDMRNIEIEFVTIR
jgi:hypothetical protein